MANNNAQSQDWANVRLTRQTVRVLQLIGDKSQTYDDVLRVMLIAGGLMDKDGNPTDLAIRDLKKKK